MQNQSNCVITFDTQLKSAILNVSTNNAFVDNFTTSIVLITIIIIECHIVYPDNRFDPFPKAVKGFDSSLL